MYFNFVFYSPQIMIEIHNSIKQLMIEKVPMRLILSDMWYCCNFFYLSKPFKVNNREINVFLWSDWTGSLLINSNLKPKYIIGPVKFSPQ